MGITKINFFDRYQPGLRLDFELFDIIGPSDAPPEAMGGSCLADTFVVTQTPALNSNVPVICGLNTGQHGKM